MAVKITAANASLSFTQCAERVLLEFGDKKPMHYKDITEKALQEGWLVTSGKTPEASMYAQVITEIKRQKKTWRTSPLCPAWPRLYRFEPVDEERPFFSN